MEFMGKFFIFTIFIVGTLLSTTRGDSTTEKAEATTTAAVKEGATASPKRKPATNPSTGAPQTATSPVTENSVVDSSSNVNNINNSLNNLNDASQSSSKESNTDDDAVPLNAAAAAAAAAVIVEQNTTTSSVTSTKPLAPPPEAAATAAAAAASSAASSSSSSSSTSSSSAASTAATSAASSAAAQADAATATSAAASAALPPQTAAIVGPIPLIAQLLYTPNKFMLPHNTNYNSNDANSAANVLQTLANNINNYLKFDDKGSGISMPFALLLPMSMLPAASTKKDKNIYYPPYYPLQSQGWAKPNTMPSSSPSLAPSYYAPNTVPSLSSSSYSPHQMAPEYSASHMAPHYSDMSAISGSAPTGVGGGSGMYSSNTMQGYPGYSHNHVGSGQGHMSPQIAPGYPASNRIPGSLAYQAQIQALQSANAGQNPISSSLASALAAALAGSNAIPSSTLSSVHTGSNAIPSSSSSSLLSVLAGPQATGYNVISSSLAPSSALAAALASAQHNAAHNAAASSPALASALANAEHNAQHYAAQTVIPSSLASSPALASVLAPAGHAISPSSLASSSALASALANAQHNAGHIMPSSSALGSVQAGHSITPSSLASSSALASALANAQHNAGHIAPTSLASSSALASALASAQAGHNIMPSAAASSSALAAALAGGGGHNAMTGYNAMTSGGASSAALASALAGGHAGYNAMPSAAASSSALASALAGAGGHAGYNAMPSAAASALASAQAQGHGAAPSAMASASALASALSGGRVVRSASLSPPPSSSTLASVAELASALSSAYDGYDALLSSLQSSQSPAAVAAAAAAVSAASSPHISSPLSPSFSHNHNHNLNNFNNNHMFPAARQLHMADLFDPHRRQISVANSPAKFLKVNQNVNYEGDGPAHPGNLQSAGAGGPRNRRMKRHLLEYLLTHNMMNSDDNMNGGYGGHTSGFEANVNAVSVYDGSESCVLSGTEFCNNELLYDTTYGFPNSTAIDEYRLSTKACKLTLCLVLLKNKYSVSKTEQNFDRIYKIINEVVNENCHTLHNIKPSNAGGKTYSGLAIKIILKAIVLQPEEYLAVEVKADGNKQVAKVKRGTEDNRNIYPIPNPTSYLIPRLVTEPVEIIPVLSGANKNYYYLNWIKRMVKNFDVVSLMRLRSNFLSVTMNQYPLQISYLIYILKYITKTDEFLASSVELQNFMHKYIIFLDEVYAGSKTDDYTYNFNDFMGLLGQPDDAQSLIIRRLFKDNDLIEFIVGPFELSAFTSQKLALQSIFSQLSTSNYLSREVKDALQRTFVKIQNPDYPVVIRKVVKNPLSHLYDDLKDEWN